MSLLESTKTQSDGTRGQLLECAPRLSLLAEIRFLRCLCKP